MLDTLKAIQNNQKLVGRVVIAVSTNMFLVPTICTPFFVSIPSRGCQKSAANLPEPKRQRTVGI
jgi:hypothetical protein